MLHALTIDVEDWPQSSLNHDLPITERAVHNTRTMLEIFRRHQTHGTFFILGLLAEKFPDLVREIAADGHEIGRHGYSHKAVFQIGPTKSNAPSDCSKTSPASRSAATGPPTSPSQSSPSGPSTSSPKKASNTTRAFFRFACGGTASMTSPDTCTGWTTD